MNRPSHHVPYDEVEITNESPFDFEGSTLQNDENSMLSHHSSMSRKVRKGKKSSSRMDRNNSRRKKLTRNRRRQKQQGTQPWHGEIDEEQQHNESVAGNGTSTPTIPSRPTTRTMKREEKMHNHHEKVTEEEGVNEEEDEGYSDDDEDSMEVPGAFNIGGTSFSTMILMDGSVHTITGGSSNVDETSLEEEDLRPRDNGDPNISTLEEGLEASGKLVIAELAPEPPEIFVGTPVTQEIGGQGKSTPPLRLLLFYAIIFVTFGAITVLVTVMILSPNDDNNNVPPTLSPTLIQGNESTSVGTPTPTMEPTTAATDKPTPAPTMTPSTPPTKIPTGTKLAIMEMLSPYIPNFPNGPVQLKSLDWLVENNGGFVATQDVTRLLERFVLSILYDSTNGDGWTDNTGWRSNDTVCTWYPGDICHYDEEGGDTVSKLNLCKYQKCF